MGKTHIPKLNPTDPGADHDADRDATVVHRSEMLQMIDDEIAAGNLSDERREELHLMRDYWSRALDRRLEALANGQKASPDCLPDPTDHPLLARAVKQAMEGWRARPMDFRDMIPVSY
jgi:hypothetical protein